MLIAVHNNGLEFCRLSDPLIYTEPDSFQHPRRRFCRAGNSIEQKKKVHDRRVAGGRLKFLGVVVGFGMRGIYPPPPPPPPAPRPPPAP